MPSPTERGRPRARFPVPTWMAVWLLLSPLVGLSSQSAPDRRILLLDAGDPDRPAFATLYTAFLDGLRSDTTFRSVVFREHLDPRLVAIDPRYATGLADVLAARFAAASLDAVVATDVVQLRVATELRDRLRRPIPIVFRAPSSVKPESLGTWVQLPDVAGVVDASPIGPMLAEIRRLRPEARHLLVIADGVEDVPTRARASVNGALDGLTIHPWIRPSLSALRDSVRRLGPDAAVLYIAVFRDGDGRPWIPADFLSAFASASAQPVFGLYRNLIGRGIVGGPVIDPARQGSALASRTLRALDAPRTSVASRFDTLGGWTSVYDWAELRRHRLPLAAIPPGAVLVGRPLRVWESNPVAFWLSLLLVTLQTFSIAALVGNRRLLRRSQERLRALTQRLQSAQDEEQARLSRDLHDTLGQDLLSQALDLERYAPTMAAPEQPTFAERLRQSVTRLEGIARELNPNALRLLDLRASLQQLAVDLRVRTGIEVTVSVPTFDPPLPPALRATVFRIVQESLVNVRRHSGAAHAAVLVRQRGMTLELTVRDDGVGFDVSRLTGARLGLLSMQERAAAVGAHLDVSSAPDDGTTVTFTLPLVAPTAV